MCPHVFFDVVLLCVGHTELYRSHLIRFALVVACMGSDVLFRCCVFVFGSNGCLGQLQSNRFVGPGCIPFDTFCFLSHLIG